MKTVYLEDNNEYEQCEPTHGYWGVPPYDLNLASDYCNRIVLLNEGKIFKEGAPDEVLTYQNIEAVYKTVVVVNNNPLNSKPYVLLVSKEK